MLLGQIPADQHTAAYTLHVDDYPRVSEPENYSTYQSLSAEEKDLFRQAYLAEPGALGRETILSESKWSKRNTAPEQTFINFSHVEYRGRYYAITATRTHEVEQSYPFLKFILNIIRPIGALLMGIASVEGLLRVVFGHWE